MIVNAVMTDHPAWQHAEDGGVYRAVRVGSAVWALTATPVDEGQMTAAQRLSGASEPPTVDVIDPGRLSGPHGIVEPLRAAGTVARWRNPDLWEALATSIMRQVIRAGHARTLHREFSMAHGERVSTRDGDAWLFPAPATVLALSDAEFGRLGLAFKRSALRAAAQAYLDFAEKWATLDPLDLIDAVQTVPRVGPWSARSTVADLTNDYALYPYADLAVRTWANRLSPGQTWPDTESEFARQWARLAGDALSDLTLLTLAWGVRHARTTGRTAI